MEVVIKAGEVHKQPTVKRAEARDAPVAEQANYFQSGKENVRFPAQRLESSERWLVLVVNKPLSLLKTVLRTCDPALKLYAVN